jgi:Protein of unknown function (DUF4240)
MIEEHFWALIEGSRQGKDQIAILARALASMSIDDLSGFENVLCQLIAESTVLCIVEACFVVQGTVTDDTLEDFLCWLILQGRERFHRALDDPDTICEWASREVTDNYEVFRLGNALVTLAYSVAENRGLDCGLSSEAIVSNTADIVGEWAESKEEFRRRYPCLVDEFWIQDRLGRLR